MIEKHILNESLKKFAVSSAVLAGFFVLQPHVMAQTASPTVGTVRAARLTQQEMNIKNRANGEIDRRIAAMNRLIDQINRFKKISADQKSALATQIQTEITNLTQLKTKIDADTDIATLRTDVQSVVKSFRIYALFIPKTRIMAHADLLLDVSVQMQALTPKLQDAITKAQSEGKDISATTALMTDRAAKLSDAITQANNAINLVSPLTPDGYPGNKTQLTQARDMLKTARTDLRTAHQDAQKVRQVLVSLKVKTASPMATPTSKSQ